MQEIFGIFGIDSRLILIQAFNFGVLLLVLWYFLYRPLLGMLAKRQEVIEGGVRDAEEAGVERQKAEESRQVVLTDANQEASTIIIRAKERALEREIQILENARVQGTRLLKDSKEQAKEDARRILEAGKEEIAQMVVLGAEKVLREQK